MRIKELGQELNGFTTKATRLSGSAELRFTIIRCCVPLEQPAAGGTRLKILEAMARRRPVVSTSRGAEGLDVIDERHLVLAETAQEIADATIALLRSPRRRADVGGEARALVESRYGWDDCAKRHLDLYFQLTEVRRQLGPAAARR